MEHLYQLRYIQTKLMMVVNNIFTKLCQRKLSENQIVASKELVGLTFKDSIMKLNLANIFLILALFGEHHNFERGQQHY